MCCPLLTRGPIRRDLRRVLAGIDRKYTIDAALKLTKWDRPTLIAWSANDRFFAPAHGERLAKLIPGARFELIDNARTFSPEDQPERLAGLIEVSTFPGWESLGAMAAHFRFVRDHHKHIKKIGVVTDSALGKVAEQWASHFVSAEIRHFSAGELEVAKQWIMNRS